MADLATMMMGAAGATGGANPNAWDISKAYYDVGPDAWDISKAYYSGVAGSVAGEETSARGTFFKPDGTKMYVIGFAGDDVNEYDLSTPWLVSSLSYNQNFSIASQDGQPQGVFFKPDGTKMYFVGSVGSSVYEYDLSSAWDISSASYLQSNSVATTPSSLFFKPDGTKMYVASLTNLNINEYDLSSAWDVSTATLLQSFSVSAQETSPHGVFFKPDGEKMYVLGSAGDDINEYDLSSAWDISTASYVQNFSVSGQSTAPFDVTFKPDGSAIYVTEAIAIYQYTIGGFSVAGQETAPQGLFFKPDGTKMYVIGSTGDDVNEYNLSAAWDVTTASYLQVFSIASQEDGPTGVFFKPDGTKMYVIGQTGDDVNEYTLSTAWNVSSASYVQNFSISAQETGPTDLFFKPDGTKMYVLGNSGDDVNEYDLSSAWDISTASYVQNFSVSAQDNAPTSLSFKPDGTKMYVIGSTGDDVNEYTLSTPWNISTASYVQNFSILSQEASPSGLFWKDDGTQFWIIGATNDRVFSYLISPE